MAHSLCLVSWTFVLFVDLYFLFCFAFEHILWIARVIAYIIFFLLWHNEANTGKYFGRVLHIKDNIKYAFSRTQKEYLIISPQFSVAVRRSATHPISQLMTTPCVTYMIATAPQMLWRVFGWGSVLEKYPDIVFLRAWVV